MANEVTRTEEADGCWFDPWCGVEGAKYHRLEGYEDGYLIEMPDGAVYSQTDLDEGLIDPEEHK